MLMLLFTQTVWLLVPAAEDRVTVGAVLMVMVPFAVFAAQVPDVVTV